MRKSISSLIALVAIVSFGFTRIGFDVNHENELLKMMKNGMAKMHAMKMTHDPDHDFASMMKVHHQTAIDMSQYELKNGKDGDLKTMAQKMIDDQKKEISELDAFLKEHAAAVDNHKFADAMKAIMNSMKMDEKKLTNNYVDRDFAILMKMHHQQAIDMSKLQLEYGTHQKIKSMATHMIEKQQKEIKELDNWLSLRRN